MGEYYEIAGKRLYIGTADIYEEIVKVANKHNIDIEEFSKVKDKLIAKQEEALGFGETLRIEYEKNKLCKDLTKNKLFELKTIRKLNETIDKVIEQNKEV